MFGNDIDKFEKKSKRRERIEEMKKSEEDLEIYLQQRNSAIGEQTKSLAESKEERAIKEYLRLREKAYGDSIQKDEEDIVDDDLESYLEIRNQTINDEVHQNKVEDELEAYKRQRQKIMREK